LDSGTAGNGLIGVGGLVDLLAVEEVRDELYDTGITGTISWTLPLSNLSSRRTFSTGLRCCRTYYHTAPRNEHG
jgi:hypothetical protein